MAAALRWSTYTPGKRFFDHMGGHLKYLGDPCDPHYRLAAHQVHGDYIGYGFYVDWVLREIACLHTVAIDRQTCLSWHMDQHRQRTASAMVRGVPEG